MYIRGKLLFVGYVFSDHSRSVRDLQKQISRSRGDYRLGLSLPSDYKLRYDCATFASVHLIYCKKLNHLSVTLITDHSNSMNIEENCQRASWNLKISPVKLLFKGQVETTRIDSVHSRPFLAVIQWVLLQPTPRMQHLKEAMTSHWPLQLKRERPVRGTVLDWIHVL